MDPSKDKKPSLTDRIMHWGELGFDPGLSEKDRATNQANFHALINSTGVLPLIPVLNFLIQPGRVPEWLRTPLTSALALLPLRDRGVQNTIEFILSVHPSNSRYDRPEGTSKGAGITHEGLNAASKLLSSPPTGMSPGKWFTAIAPQLFALLEGEGEPGMDKAAAFIVGFGILGRKQYGAPGMPGWKAFVEPIFRCIDPSLVPFGPSVACNTSDEHIRVLGASKVLVSSNEVSQGLLRLTALVTSHPHPSLTKRLLRPILLPLWALSSWAEDIENTDSRFRKPARKLLRTFIQLSSGQATATSSRADNTSNPTSLSIVVHNLIFKGRMEPGKTQWVYATSSGGGVQIQESRPQDASMPDLVAVDEAADRFVEWIKFIPDFDEDISHLFMNLCTKWLGNGKTGASNSIRTHAQAEESKTDIERDFVEAKVLQRMMTEIPEKLVSDSRQVLNLVKSVLSDYSSPEGSSEDVIAVALSLLNIVLTSPGFREALATNHTLESIQSSLVGLSKQTHLDISSTARNLLMLMKYQSSLEGAHDSAPSATNDRHVEDRKSYNLAMSYITATDSPPPVRVQGLELISDLIGTNSSVLDIPALTVMFSSLLQDDEEYIYLRAIKSFIELSKRHPKAVMKDLIDCYADLNEEYELDQRLKFGEALLQVIQSSPLAFTGEAASSVSQGLMSIAGRRGLRPKTEREQQKRNRLKRKKDQEAEEAWDGPVPQLDEALNEKERKDSEMLQHIISGWESKRGTEDVRVRASAVSILTSAIEANVGGIGSNLISTIVDLSIHILTLEPEPEKGILRRSAILLILGFVRALDSARSEGRNLGFGFVGQSLDDVSRILRYVDDTDNDGLVRQHARDVVESLEAWHINALLPQRSTETDIHELAGLSIYPGDSSHTNQMRPRIEEIE